ncbi:MAG TPA: RAMP superfamily CRISPR-associated protein [Bryobacteraceae bacterium]|nr:RAMP superfamily CRISPR-associated protein [Bryobacteraceae bacterium]
MSVYDYYLSGDGDGRIGNLLQASRAKAAAEWSPSVELFYPQATDLAGMPDGSWLLRIEFWLAKPYTSKAEFHPYDGEHEIQNPIIRDHTTGLPMVRPTTWKGHLGFAARLAGSDRCDRLFGAALGNDEGQAGRLHFFPTFFLDTAGREVITPLSRETRTPVRGPIDFEVLRPGSAGRFHLLYVPRPNASKWASIGDDLRQAALAVKSMLLDYGFSAKKTSGWGIAKDEVQSGILVARGSAWPELAKGHAARASFVEPGEALLKFMDKSGLPISRLKQSSGKWLSNPEFKSAGAEFGSLTEYKKFRSWYDVHGAEWMRRQTGRPEIGVRREYPFGRVTEFVNIANTLAADLRQVPDA